jgi:ABC-type protease/lipase transport system fused ATPase/permease subunit
VDWDLASDVFDASFRRSVGRRKVNVQQLMGDLLALRQFLTGGPALALIAAPFAIIFVIVGALFHPYLAAFIAVAVMLMMISAYVSQKVSSPILKRANDESAESQRIAASSLEQASVGMSGIASSSSFRSTRAKQAAWSVVSRDFSARQCLRCRSRSVAGWQSMARSRAAWSSQRAC